MRLRLAVFLSILVPLDSWGDDLTTASEQQSGQPGRLEETAHTVEVSCAGGVATMVVTRRFADRGADADEAIVTVDLPPGGVAVGLRSRGRDGTWHDGALMGYEAAAKGYGDSNGADPATDLALLSAKDGSLLLQLYPVTPDEERTVEYTLLVPTKYEGGSFIVYYPEADEVSHMAAPLVHADGAALTRGSVLPQECVSDECDTPPEGTFTRVAFPSPAWTDVAARLGALELAYGRILWRLEVDAPPRLAAAPTDARVVFVVDASYSEGKDGIADQLALVRGYVADLPDARFDLVIFRHQARRLVGSFVGKDRFLKALGRAGEDVLAPGNGSNLDAALELAARSLAGVKRPARIVALTDARMRSAFSTGRAGKALVKAPEGTILHVVVRSGQPDYDLESSERRNDAHPLAPLAERWGGVVLEIDGRLTSAERNAELVLGLVRPIRIDAFTVTGDGLGQPEALVIQPSLAEGSGVRLTAVGSGPRAVTLHGKVWARDWELPVPIDAGQTGRTAALALGDDKVLEDLSQDEELTAALAGNAVSEWTSFLAGQPGMRPTQLEGGGMSYGTNGFGTYSTTSSCGGSMWDDSDGLAELLSDRLKPAIAACARRHRVKASQVEGSVRFETTGDEIVDVTVSGVASARFGACLADAAWAVRLDDNFKQETGRYDVPVQLEEPE